MGTVNDDWDEEQSVIGDKGDIGFIDYADDKSMSGYHTVDNDGPVSISVPFPLNNGKPRSGFVGETIVDKITIENNTDESIQLWSVSIYDSKPEDSFTLSLMEPPNENSDEEYKSEFVECFTLEDRILRVGRPLTIWLSCKPKSIGMHTSAVHFDVGDESIERLAFLLAEDKISLSLASSKPFQRRSKKKQLGLDNFSADAFVTASRPSKPNKEGFFKNRLPNYPIPKEIREMIENKQAPDVVLEGLTKMNYASYFKTLLIMEEIKLEEDMRGYDMERVRMKSNFSGFLMLEVPGLAEKRPSLLRGDYILAKPAFQDTNERSPAYQGYIYRVEAEEVYLKFNKDFHINYHSSNEYNVQFTYNRTMMRRQYQALEATQGLETQLLFPSESFNKRFIAPAPLVPISGRINEQQMQSVEMILGCKGGAPYVIHGPPGTGKTMTLSEAILQIYKNRKNSRVLVCAPSNSAADHILEKLLGSGILDEAQKKEICRLNALSRPIDDIETDYLGFCYVDHGEMIFKCPPINELKRYRIVISTYASSSLLYAEGIKRGHFSHIFLDEAGQASEPETMVPLSNLYQPATVVVLAGDQMQLGPVIFSKDAESYGLGKSYLERLFESSYYESGDENYVTKLVQNYRCHHEILHLPSELFYKGELIACKEDTKSSVDWTDLLPNKDFPVLFIGIQGCDEREGNNPSWFNRTEASKVVENINILIEKKGYTENDIGVIAPYRQQVLKIKKALESVDRADLKVGSVEQFQGQEREVIIISTVRSTIKHNEFDRNFCLGFLSNRRRFNVAITRAKSLLIIIGNPHIICQDKHWNMLLWRCHDNRSYQGCCLPERKEVFDENDGYGQGEAYATYDEVPPANQGEWGHDSSNQGEWSQGGDWGQDSANQGDWGQDSANQGDWGQDSANQGDWGQDTADKGDWGQDSADKGDWGQDSADKGIWGQDSADKGDWGQDSADQGTWDQDSANKGEWSQGGDWVQDSASQGGKWEQDSSNLRKEYGRNSSNRGGWGQDSSNLGMKYGNSSNAGGWGQDSSNPGKKYGKNSSNTEEWGQDSSNLGKKYGKYSSNKGEWSQKSSDKREWVQEPSGNGKWGRESSYQDVDFDKLSFKPGEIPKAVIDPDQFSDGWK